MLGGASSRGDNALSRHTRYGSDNVCDVPACGADDHELLVMVYISSWQEFQEAAEGLYEKSPNKVRVLVLSFHATMLKDISRLGTA